MSAQIAGLPDRRYLLPGVIVFGGALIAYFVGVVPAQGEANDRLADLRLRHAAVTTTLGTPGGPVTQGRLQAAQDARERLKGEHDKCAQLFVAADVAFEKYFADYQGRRDLPNPTDFKRAYRAAARSLASNAEGVAARDANGQKLSPFLFRDWEGGPPSQLEIQPAQKEYWIQDSVLHAVKSLDGAALRAVRIAQPERIHANLAAALPALGVSRDQQDRWTTWQSFECTAEIEIRSARVADAVAAFSALKLGSAQQALISELRGVRVRASSDADVRDFLEVVYDPAKGETPEGKVDIDAGEPSVILTLTFAVLDPPTAGSAS